MASLDLSLCVSLNLTQWIHWKCLPLRVRLNLSLCMRLNLSLWLYLVYLYDYIESTLYDYIEHIPMTNLILSLWLHWIYTYGHIEPIPMNMIEFISLCPFESISMCAFNWSLWIRRIVLYGRWSRMSIFESTRNGQKTKGNKVHNSHFTSNFMAEEVVHTGSKAAVGGGLGYKVLFLKMGHPQPLFVYFQSF